MKTMGRRRGGPVLLRRGEIYAVQLDSARHALLQCEFPDFKPGFQIFRVLRGRYETDEIAAVDVATLAAAPHEYRVFWDLRGLVDVGGATLLATAPVPSFEPAQLRFLRHDGDDVWVETNAAGREVVRLSDGPDAHQRRLAQLWTGPDSHLREVLRTSRDRSLSPHQLASGPSSGHPSHEPTGAHHFVLFSSPASLAEAMHLLQADPVLSPLAARQVVQSFSGIFALVVRDHAADPEAPDSASDPSIETHLRDLARAVGGSYEGAERPPILRDA